MSFLFTQIVARHVLDVQALFMCSGIVMTGSDRFETLSQCHRCYTKQNF